MFIVRMKYFSMTCLALFTLFNTALAQFPTARVQVLHNSPTPTIDVYVNGIKTFDDFEFRKASPYQDLPAGIPLSVGIAPSNSQSAADILETFIVTFEAGRTYHVTANGVIFNADTPLSLIMDEYARETPFSNDRVAVSFIHGSPGAPAVDFSVRTGNKLVGGLGYGQYSSYLDLPNQDYFIDVKTAGTNTILATYRVDLTPHAGKAIKIFASGFIGNDPPFGLYGCFADGNVIAFPLGPVCRVQVINNSPSASLDFFKNGAKIYDDLAFRNAKPFAFVPADLFFNIGVGPASTASVSDTFYNTTYTFQNGKDYIVTLDGIPGSTTTPFAVHINETGREFALDTTKAEVAFFHGAPGAPSVDADALFYADNLVQNLSFGQFTPYASLTPDKYDFAIRPSGSGTTVATFRADFSNLKGKTAYVFASGLLSGSPGFGLFAALADGTVIPLGATPLSRVQIIHNAPPPTVDLYAGKTLLLNDFAFRSATPFLNVPADRNINIGVAAANSQSSGESIVNFPVNFSSAKQYVVYATGVIGDPVHPFTLVVNDKAVSTTAPGFVSFSVAHGIPDISGIDIAARFIGDLVEDLSYSAYSYPYTQLATGEYILDVKPANLSQILETYVADFSGFDGQALHLFASGYFAGSPAYGLFAATSDGTVFELSKGRFARLQVVHNAPDKSVDVYAFGDPVLEDFAFRSATPYFTVPAEIEIPFIVAPDTSSSDASGFATIPMTFENNKTYVLVASGIAGNAATPFTLLKKEGAREEALDPASLELCFLHGVPDANPVRLVNAFDGPVVLNNLSYGNFSDYIGFEADVIIADVEAAATPNKLLGTYGGDFTGADGVSALVFASGLLNGAPGLELWMAFADGTCLPMPAFSYAQAIHNSPEPEVDAYYVDASTGPGGAAILDNFTFRSATGWGLLPAGVPFDLAVAPANSSSAGDAIYSKGLELTTGKMYTMMFGGVVGSADKPFELFLDDNARRRSSTATAVDVNLFHGAPDAPAVDLVSPLAGVLFNNVSYGDFAPYISTTPGDYVVNLTPADNNNQLIQRYNAPLSTYGGQSLTAFASGYLTGGQAPGFEIWVATAEGETFPLEVISDSEEQQTGISAVHLSPNPSSDLLNLSIALDDATALRYAIRDLSGRLIMERNVAVQPDSFLVEKIGVSEFEAGLYLLELNTGKGVKTLKFSVQR